MTSPQKAREDRTGRVRRILFSSRSRGGWRTGLRQEAQENLLWSGLARLIGSFFR